MLFAWITDPNAWLALGTLTLLEIVLGIDNIIFLSLVVAKLPTAQRNHARRIGLAAAMIMRLALLASIAWVTRLTNPLFEVFGEAISARDLILLLGGLFLIWKASKEIHESIEGEEEGLKTRVHETLDRHAFDYTLDWHLSGQPYLTPRGTLVDALSAAIQTTCGIEPEISTTGGTSDGRFIAAVSDQVVEFGPVNASIHKIDECIALDAIDPLSIVYRRALENLLLDTPKS